MKTEIEWISTDEQLPSLNDRILVLLPHMDAIDRGRNWMEIRQCRVGKDGYSLYTEEGKLDWDAEDAMWWAWLPDWMEVPGWRKT